MEVTDDKKDFLHSWGDHITFSSKYKHIVNSQISTSDHFKDEVKLLILHYAFLFSCKLILKQNLVTENDNSILTSKKKKKKKKESKIPVCIETGTFYRFVHWPSKGVLSCLSAMFPGWGASLWQCITVPSILITFLLNILLIFASAFFNKMDSSFVLTLFCFQGYNKLPK